MENPIAERCAVAVALVVSRSLRGELLSPDRRLADREHGRWRGLGIRCAGIEYGERPDENVRSKCADHGPHMGNLYARSSMSSSIGASNGNAGLEGVAQVLRTGTEGQWQPPDAWADHLQGESATPTAIAVRGPSA